MLIRKTELLCFFLHSWTENNFEYLWWESMSHLEEFYFSSVFGCFAPLQQKYNLSHFPNHYRHYLMKKFQNCPFLPKLLPKDQVSSKQNYRVRMLIYRWSKFQLITFLMNRWQMKNENSLSVTAGSLLVVSCFKMFHDFMVVWLWKVFIPHFGLV